MSINNPSPIVLNAADAVIWKAELVLEPGTISGTFGAKPGSWVMRILGMTDPAHGAIDWYVDGQLVVRHDDWCSPIKTIRVVKLYRIEIPEGPEPHLLQGMLYQGARVDLDKIWFKR